MAQDEPAASGAPTKLVIKKAGLMLSGDLENPILDADAIVAVNGRITAIGRAHRAVRRERAHVPRVLCARCVVKRGGIVRRAHR